MFSHRLLQSTSHIIGCRLYRLGLKRDSLAFIERACALAEEEQRENIGLLELGLAAQRERRGARGSPDHEVNLVVGKGVTRHDVEGWIYLAAARKKDFTPFELKLSSLKRIRAPHGLDPSG